MVKLTIFDDLQKPFVGLDHTNQKIFKNISGNSKGTELYIV